MTINLPYRPRMRQSERVTSTLAVPLALSSAILVVLLVLATTPQVMRLPHTPRELPDVLASHGPSAATTTSTNLPDHETTAVAHGRQRDVSTTSTSTVPHQLFPLAQPIIASGTVSGGAMSISYQPILGPQTVQLISSLPIALSVWDGDCVIDEPDHVIHNNSATSCTLQLQSDSYTSWQLVALA